MKPVTFPEVNCTYAEDQPEYLPLPVYRDAEGGTISCWQLSWREKLKILFTGKLWIDIHTFNSPLQPIRPYVDKEMFLPKEEEAHELHK